MSKKARPDSTEQLIQEAEALGGKKSGAGKKAPKTRVLIRDAERMLGKSAAGPSPLLMALVAVVVVVAALGLFFFMR